MTAREESERLRKEEFSRTRKTAAADIGLIPAPVNPARKKSCKNNLHKFLRTYFPKSTGLKPFGPGQINAIKLLERAVLKGGRYLDLQPRGYCKSTRGENATLWMILYRHKQYVLFLGANAEMASMAIESIKMELAENDLLYEDFPEVVHAIRHLENKTQRCKSQTHGAIESHGPGGKRVVIPGAATHIEWTSDRLVMPTIEGVGGQIVAAAGLLAASRGSRHKQPNGTTARPDFVIIDDPQTDESALSPAMTAKRMRTLQRGIMQLGGHGNKISAGINATVIEPDDMVDQLADPVKHPEWPTVRTSGLVTLPTNDAIERHWMGEYRRIRGDYNSAAPDGPQIARGNSLQYYKRNRKEMDAGALAEWKHIPLDDDEISPIQHAMNVWVDDGEAAFWSEVMNRPLRPQIASPLDLTLTGLEQRCCGYDRQVVPEGRSHLVYHVDVHDELLFWSVAAVGQDFSGELIDYGTWPHQTSPWFTLANAKTTLSKIYPGASTEGAIQQGIIDCIYQIHKTPWAYADGQRCSISVGLVDAGYKPAEVANAIRMCRYDRVYTCRGLGSGPTEKPMPEYDVSPKRVLRAGPDPGAPRWFFPRENADPMIRRVNFDSNFWKDTLAGRLTQQALAGQWRFFGKNPGNLKPYIEHLLSERPSQITARGRTVNVWKKQGNRDNHWFDTLVGCAVAASISGAQLGDQPPRQTSRKKRTRQQSKPLVC